MRSKVDEKDSISVIIPVYNAKDTLERCLDSVLNQNYDKFEVIIIDDGSNDGSEIICDAYQRSDHRIRVIHQTNQGVSEARNKGLCLARGEFIQFVDSDDYLDESFGEIMRKAIKQNNCELAICSYYNMYENKKKKSCHAYQGCYSLSSFILFLMEDPYDYYYGVLWNKLYRREIINKKQIQFRADLRFGEDFVFNLEYWSYCKTVAMIDKPLYCYIQIGQNSLVRKKKDTQTRIDERVELFLHYRDFCIKTAQSRKVRKKVREYMIKYVPREYEQIIFHSPALTKKERKACKEYVIDKCLVQFGLYRRAYIVWAYLSLYKYHYFSAIRILEWKWFLANHLRRCKSRSQYN